MLAFKRVGENRLAESAQCRTLIDVDAVYSAHERAVDTGVGIGGVGRRAGPASAGGCVCNLIALTIVKIENVIVACLVVGEDRIKRAHRDGVVGVGAEIEAARNRIIFAGQTIEFVFGFARPETRLKAGAAVLRNLFPIDLEIVGNHVALIIATRKQNADFADIGIEYIGQR